MVRFRLLVLGCLAMAFSLEAASVPGEMPLPAERLFARTNLFAWCIVPFDSARRNPEQRADMLVRLKIPALAYDYRAEHVPTFEAEVRALQGRGLKLLAWWTPAQLNDETKHILGILKRHNLRPQLWVIGGGNPVTDAAGQNQNVTEESERLRPLAEAAAAAGCTIGLYNHGGWFGEPENQLAIIQRLRAQGVTNIGIVYNLHHGHSHIDRFPELLQKIKPHLIALNLNGMTRNGDQVGKKILPLAQGDLDLQVLRTIAESGWFGPVGILNHTDEDAETRLRDNLEGLEWLIPQLKGQAPGPKPQPRSWRDPAKPKLLPPIPPVKTPGPSGVKTNIKATIDYWAVEDAGQREKLPLYQVIPAATAEELTPANNLPPRAAYRVWQRSHGDNGGTRFSALDQVNRQNVTNLQVAWVYHSRDGSNNIQCNPIIVGNTLFTPTAGHFLAAINAATGVESWRFKPEGRPAFRGLTFWSGRDTAADRVLFCAGKFVYALDPKTGHPVPGFGQAGKVILPGVAQGE
ncbi:MAG TPA: pyrrolo-quinoline quinone, partial [Clostridia bacterium]|nr:pyrrolo-quinoline quinone [Clostridia bacterium]